jgi:hypothetical protein
MKPEADSELLPFYFGTLESDQRLQVERRLLEEPDALIDYFDLKRKLEAADILPSQPSARVWSRLSLKIKKTPKKALFTVSLSAALAAGIALFVLHTTTLSPHPVVGNSAQNPSVPGATGGSDKSDHGVLFELNEPSSGSTVL